MDQKKIGGFLKSLRKEKGLTQEQAAEYSNQETKRATKIVLIYLIIGMVSLIANQALMLLGVGGTFWAGFAKGATAGLALCALIFALLYVTGRLTKLSDAKKRAFQKTE